MGQFVPKVFDSILTRMINRVVARTSLTDINDGSSLKQVLAAAAREDDDQFFQMVNLLDLFDIMKARGTDLDERAKEFNQALISRNQPRRATGTVVFSRAGIVGTVTAGIGTQVQVPASGSTKAITAVTTVVGTITPGNTTSAPVAAQMTEAGIIGNVAPDTIVGFGTKPSGIDAVTNPAAWTNGADLESDDSFRRRIIAEIKGLARCHIAGLEAAVMGIEDPATGKVVMFASVYEDIASRGDVILYIDDGSGTAEDAPINIPAEVIINPTLGGETDFYLTQKPIKPELGFTFAITTLPALVRDVDYTLDPADGHIKLLAAAHPTGAPAGQSVTCNYWHFTGLIQIVQKVVDGDTMDRVNYPGYRAAGVQVRVLSPLIHQLVVTANITVRPGYSQVTVAAAVKAALSAYVNALGISEDVVLAELIEQAMAVPGMQDIHFTAPTANQMILDDQIARLILSNISIT